MDCSCSTEDYSKALSHLTHSPTVSVIEGSCMTALTICTEGKCQLAYADDEAAGGAENAGAENAGVENTGAITYEKPSNRK